MVTETSYTIAQYPKSLRQRWGSMLVVNVNGESAEISQPSEWQHRRGGLTTCYRVKGRLVGGRGLRNGLPAQIRWQSPSIHHQSSRYCIPPTRDMEGCHVRGILPQGRTHLPLKGLICGFESRVGEEVLLRLTLQMLQ